MPTYDYVCGACGHIVEVIHGVHDQGPTECPNCHARAMRKAITSPTVLYKGSGWAKKDRGASARTKAAAKAGSPDTGATPASADKGGSGSDKGGSGSDKGSGSGTDKGSGSGSGSESSSSSGTTSAPSAPSAKPEGD